MKPFNRLALLSRVTFSTTPLVFAVVLAGCQAMRSLELQSTQFTITPQQESQLGSQFSQEIQKEVTILDDPQAQAWVNSLGKKLVQYSPPCPQEFVFQVTTAEEVNAFAIPGGYCYVNLGLIKLAENEAEVAAVVGHEINHVTMRHGVRSMQRAVGVELLSQAIQSDNETMDQVVGLVEQAGGVVAMRSFGREDEREADELGVVAMYKAGYDPRAAIAFFQKLHDYAQSHGATDGGLLGDLLSTHPATTERIENIKTQVQTFDLSVPLTLSTPEFEQLKQRLAAK